MCFGNSLVSMLIKLYVFFYNFSIIQFLLFLNATTWTQTVTLQEHCRAEEPSSFLARAKLHSPSRRLRLTASSLPCSRLRVAAGTAPSSGRSFLACLLSCPARVPALHLLCTLMSLQLLGPSQGIF